MKPATKHALFEMSTYAQIELKLQPSIKEVLKKNMLYGILLLCDSVLCRLLSDHPDITWRTNRQLTDPTLKLLIY